MECLGAKLKENSNGFAEVWRPLIANLPRNLRDGFILRGMITELRSESGAFSHITDSYMNM